jgi:hypothetical protein
MSPRNSNNNGGTLGRAAFGGTSRADAARADDMRVFARVSLMIVLTICLAIVTAPDIWPQLFGQ